MRASGPSFLAAIGLRRLVTIVASAIVAGVVVGYALATLNSPDEPGFTAVQRTPTAAGSPPGRTEASAVEAVLFPAATASGKQRRRARLMVTVSLRNGSDRRRAATATPMLIVDDRRLPPDPAAAAEARGLLDSLPALTIVSGVLRFETAGSITQRLTTRRRARLRIAGQTLALRIAVSSQPPTP